MKNWETYEKERAAGKNASPPKRDLGTEVLVRALRREIPVHIHCATASEIASCIRSPTSSACASAWGTPTGPT